jgi:GT2 family glycosyltransferase/glycosyltransferase involved in cell wall biosynthesis
MPRPVLIILPFYRNEQLVADVVESLIACADDIAAIQGEVLLYNDSPDYQPLADALAAILPAANGAFPCRVEHNPRNLGFVQTANRGLGEAIARRRDALLLNSDVRVFPGALLEMARVAALDPMIGFVNPRSNNATVASLPLQERFRENSPAPAHAAYQTVAFHLPQMTYAPTAVGFCMLIRWAILAEFGGFDEVYGAGYNEENDLVMRAARCGYRAALANKAFVWHRGGQSFDATDIPQAKREAANRPLLLARYPEYAGLIDAYLRSPEHVAETLLGALVPDIDGRIDLALDFSSFTGAHNGTFEAGRQLIGEAARHWGERFNLFVLCSEAAYAFHGYADLGAPRRDPDGPEIYAAIFRVGQPYDWKTVERLWTRAAVVGVAMLDTISVDCSQQSTPRLHNIWQFTLEHADLITTISQFTADQLERRFRYGPGVLRRTAMLSLDTADYGLTEAAGAPAGQPGALPAAGYILVTGNAYPHKHVAPTANALSRQFPDRLIVALGMVKAASGDEQTNPLLPDQTLRAAANVTDIAVGALSPGAMSSLYAGAGVIIFPSHYEGFGIPVLNALAARKPVFVRRTPVFEELWQGLSRTQNIHFYETTDDLADLLRTPPPWIDEAPVASAGGADRSAREIRQAIEQSLANADYGRIVSRLRAVQLVNDVAAGGRDEGRTNAALLARDLGHKVEKIAERVLTTPVVLQTSRRLARWVRAIRAGARLG